MPLSYQNYTGDNVTTTFNIPFTYTATSEISVTVDGVAQTGLTFPSASQVQLTSAPASSTVVQVRRTTDLTSRAVDFASGSVLTEEDLDNANIQIFHSSQEAVDLTDDTIQEDVDSKWDAESKVIKNVANPTNAQDAATKDYLENTWLTPADKAQLNSLNTTNLNTVATNIANVNAVAADATDIGTVSTNIASVNTVATNINDVITVANDLNEAISEIETAADDLNEAVSDIDTVSTNIANVNTVGGAITNVNTVAGINSNVTTVAGISGNVTTVAGISGNVTSVAGNAANINTVAGNTANINTVATNNSDISTVSSISSDVSTVAGITSNIADVVSNEANINTVAGINSNVTTVANNNANVTTTATNIANINSVAGNSGNINAVAANETNINSVNSNSTNINTVATNISNVNSVGGSIANVNTVASNLASVNNFGEVYRIASSAPTSSLDIGDLYFDTTSDTLKVYGASGWQSAGSSINGTSQRYHYDITGTPTSVTGADANGNTLSYDAGYVDVYVNGVRMSQADVTVTSGDTVTFASALANGDEVDIVGYGTFAVASLNADNLDSGTVPDARITGAYTGITNLTMSGDLTVDTSTLYVDSANNRVGIGNTNPNGGRLHVTNSTGAIGYFQSTQSASNVDNIILNSTQTNSSANATFQINNGTTAQGQIRLEGNNSVVFLNGTSLTERMRIDSSGNLLVGKTSTDTNVAGSILGDSGYGAFCRDGNKVAIFNRKTSDGQIIDFQKDGTTVGTIGSLVSGRDLHVNSTGGILTLESNFNSTERQVVLGDTYFGVVAGDDNAVDLGRSSARYKDLYLSGGVYLGGTGSANYLDDYETGDFQPAFESTGATFSHSTRAGNYVVIGQFCFFTFRVGIASISGTQTNSARLTLPFTTDALSGTYHGGSFGHYFNVDLSTTGILAYQTSSSSSTVELKVIGDNIGETAVLASHLKAGTEIRGHIMYKIA